MKTDRQSHYDRHQSILSILTGLHVIASYDAVLIENTPEFITAMRELDDAVWAFADRLAEVTGA